MSITMKDITMLKDTPLKVIVGEKKEKTKMDTAKIDHHPSYINGINDAIDKTLSTPLPDVNDCVEIDVEKVIVIIEKCLDEASDVDFEKEILGNECDDVTRIAKAIANSKSILTWRKVDKPNNK